MQKLRDLYAETQNNARNNFDKITLDRCKKIQAYANKEIESASGQDDYTNLEELMFYQEKYAQLIEKFNTSLNDKTKKPKLQSDVLAILSDNFKAHSNANQPPQPPKAEHPVSPVRKEERVQRPKEKQHLQSQQKKPLRTEQKTFKAQQKTFKNEQKLIRPQLDHRDTINSYFEMKKNEIEKSKIGFKSVLQNIPKASHKYAVRSNIQVKKENDENISKLTKQVDQLSKKLHESKLDSQQNLGIVQAQKKDYEAKINDLIHQIEKLNRQNEKLKHPSKVVSSQPSPPIQPQPIIQHVYVKTPKHEDFSDPYVINYRSNDMFQLNKKYHGTLPSHSNYNTKTGSSEMKAGETGHRASEEDILLKAFPEHYTSEPLKHESQFEKSNLKFNKSEVQSEDKNIIIRSKLSFFKSSMVLYRSDQFELAIKSCDLVPLQSRKIGIYINNKDRLTTKVDLSYSCDPSYYQIKTSKKLTEVQGLKQGKQQLQVTLKNRNDLDSLIEAKLTINHKTIKFIIPTLMIQFLPAKRQAPKNTFYEKHAVSPVISQYSSIFTAMEIIPLEKDLEQRMDVGTAYARSKYHEGAICMRWKGRNEVEIESIKPWVLFLSYLMLKDY